MGTRVLQFLTVSSLALLLAFVVGCAAKTPGRSNLGTNIGGRDVKASLDGPGFISSEGDAAVVKFVGGKLLIEKGAVQLDGQEVAKLAEGVRRVDVDYTDGTLTVTADGQLVFSQEIPK